MVLRQGSALRLVEALSRGLVLAHLWPDRSARNRGMDSGRQTRRALSAPDAQVHLDADAAWCLSDARAWHRRPADETWAGSPCHIALNALPCQRSRWCFAAS